MAIGMLAAMEAIQGKARPDDNSVVPPIDRLAVLPQAMIMSMAEKGQIPKDMVMPILGRKAENAEAAAQIKAAAQQMAQQQQMGGPPPSTVFEKVMAQNAAREAAPMTRENTGIANVPMQKQMFAGKRAGGIVAFSGRQGSYVKDFEALPEVYTDPVFEGQPLSKFARRFVRPRGVSSLLSKKTKVLPDGRAVSFGEYMRMRDVEDAENAKARLAENKNENSNPFIGAVAETETDPSPKPQIVETDPPPKPQIVDPDAVRPAKIPEKGSMTPAELEADMKRAGAEDSAIEKEAFAQEQLDKEAKQKKVLGRPEEEIVGLQDQIKEMADTSIAAFDKLGFDKPEKFDPSKFSTEALRTELQENGVNLNLLSEQASALAEEKLKLGKDKKEALAFFGLEAGLNILAGKDPNALVNIGAGAGKAIAPLRKELTRIKDQHNALRKEENALAKMENDQDMGIAKFSLKRFDAAKERAAKVKESYERTKATFIAQNTRTIASLRTGMAQAEATRASTEATQASRREITALRLATEKERAVNRALETLQKNLEYTQAPPEEKKKMEDAVRKRALSGFASSSSNNLTSKLDLSGFTDITP